MAVIIKRSQKLFYEDYAYKVRLKMPTGYNQYIKTLLRYAKDDTVEKKIASLVGHVEARPHSGRCCLYQEIASKCCCNEKTISMQLLTYQRRSMGTTT